LPSSPVQERTARWRDMADFVNAGVLGRRGRG